MLIFLAVIAMTWSNVEPIPSALSVLQLNSYAHFSPSASSMVHASSDMVRTGHSPSSSMDFWIVCVFSANHSSIHALVSHFGSTLFHDAYYFFRIFWVQIAGDNLFLETFPLLNFLIDTNTSATKSTPKMITRLNTSSVVSRQLLFIVSSSSIST